MSDILECRVADLEITLRRIAEILAPYLEHKNEGLSPC